MADFEQRQIDATRERRLRGIVLEMVHTRHRQQGSHLDGVMMWGLLDKMGFPVGQADVVTVLQDLCDRGYLNCDQRKNSWTGRVQILKVSITPKGRDLVEHTSADPAVLIP